jgi:hypothetical protein
VSEKRCGFCRGIGHNSRTCPKMRKALDAERPEWNPWTAGTASYVVNTGRAPEGDATL